jgi:hypothetical protein
MSMVLSLESSTKTNSTRRQDCTCDTTVFAIMPQIECWFFLEVKITEPVEELSQVVSLETGVPILVEIRSVMEHRPPNPQGVTAACYARPRSSKRFFGPTWTDGIVTARHVLNSLGFGYSTSVPMANGTSSSLVDVDGATTIDASILSCSAFTASPLGLATVAPGSTVEVDTSINTPFNAQVLRIFEHPSYFGNLISHRAFIDTSGASGDSGSLVKQITNDDVVGIYIGSTTTAGGDGIVQCMRQVVQYFDIGIFI